MGASTWISSPSLTSGRGKIHHQPWLVRDGSYRPLLRSKRHPRPSWPGAFFRIGLLAEVTLQQTSEGLAAAGWPPRIRSVGEPPAGFDLLWAESIRPKPRVGSATPRDEARPGRQTCPRPTWPGAFFSYRITCRSNASADQRRPCRGGLAPTDPIRGGTPCWI